VRLTRPIVYRSYLLRSWEGRSEPGERRFIVEMVTGMPSRWGFASIDELLDFLREELERRQPAEEQPPDQSRG
jgi:hypothetical protein